MSLASGTVISHYRIERQLGAGGMGEVYLAQDLSLHRLVALKLLSAPDDGTARKRLLQEARAAAALDHPSICAVYEVGTDAASGDFIAMQYVEGEPLSERLLRRRMPPVEALTICRQITEALRVAHRAGVVHRDLKPHNIMLTPGGDVKLLDFGIAKRVLSPQMLSEMATASQITHPESLMGTPAYMAPEQARGQAADYRSDIFALGCVAYECLTGKRAFAGATTADILGKVMEVDPPPPSVVVPELGTSYDSLCARMLRKEASERFQSADEVMGALQALMPTRASSASVSAPFLVRKSPMFNRATVVAAVVLLAAVGVWYWYSQSGRELPPAPDDARLYYERGVEALREGTYFSAKNLLEESISKFPDYVEAWLRLAQAYQELDDSSKASDALVKVSSLAPNLERLPSEVSLRLGAIRFAVLGEHDKAETNYKALAARRTDDPGIWLDLGRVQQAAGRSREARDSYTKALSLRPSYAAAQLRLGALPGTVTDTALSHLDEAVRLYHLELKTEGEVEALLQKVIVLWYGSAKQSAESRAVIDQVLALAVGPPYLSQKLRAQFELVRISAKSGAFAEAAELGKQAVEESTRAGLLAIAANGLIDLSGVYISAGKLEEADATLSQAVEIAQRQRARRHEMRAHLQRAALRAATHHYDEAIAIATSTLPYFGNGRFPRFEITAKNVIARAKDALGHYDEATALAQEMLKVAESTRDDTQVGDALGTLATSLRKQGRLPEAADTWARLEELNLRTGALAGLWRVVTNRAELLILMSRIDEATRVLDAVAERVKRADPLYANRGPRVATLRTLLAATRNRFTDVETEAASAEIQKSATGLAPLALVLREYARAQMGKSLEKPAEIAAWAHDPASGKVRPDLAYWSGRTLLARREHEAAYRLALETLNTPEAQANQELTWRLAAVAALGSRGLSVAPDSATMAARADAAYKAVETAWSVHAPAYMARPDLTTLRSQLVK